MLLFPLRHLHMHLLWYCSNPHLPLKLSNMWVHGAKWCVITNIERQITVENIQTHVSFIISQKPSFPAFSLAFWKILAWNSLSHWNDSLVFRTKSSWLQILVEKETDNPTKNPHIMKIWRYSDGIIIILKYENLIYTLSCFDLNCSYL